MSVEPDKASAGASPSRSSDLGRRIQRRREHLGLSRAEVANRAGIPDAYLEYLETRPTVAPSSSSIVRLAVALETSVNLLLGANADVAPGGAPAVRSTRLVTLDEADCWSRVGSHGVGHLAFESSDGPITLPVNYAVEGHDIYLRTAQDSVIASIEPSAKVGFEVDHIDDSTSTGWSVLVYANCEHLGTSEVHGGPSPTPDPWAGGPREHRIRLHSRSVVGRLIESDL